MYSLPHPIFPAEIFDHVLDLVWDQSNRKRRPDEWAACLRQTSLVNMAFRQKSQALLFREIIVDFCSKGNYIFKLTDVVQNNPRLSGYIESLTILDAIDSIGDEGCGCVPKGASNKPKYDHRTQCREKQEEALAWLILGIIMRPETSRLRSIHLFPKYVDTAYDDLFDWNDFIPALQGALYAAINGDTKVNYLSIVNGSYLPIDTIRNSNLDTLILVDTAFEEFNGNNFDVTECSSRLKKLTLVVSNDVIYEDLEDADLPTDMTSFLGITRVLDLTQLQTLTVTLNDDTYGSLIPELIYACRDSLTTLRLHYAIETSEKLFPHQVISTCSKIVNLTIIRDMATAAAAPDEQWSIMFRHFQPPGSLEELYLMLRGHPEDLTYEEPDSISGWAFASLEPLDRTFATKRWQNLQKIAILIRGRLPSPLWREPFEVDPEYMPIFSSRDRNTFVTHVNNSDDGFVSTRSLAHGVGLNR